MDFAVVFFFSINFILVIHGYKIILIQISLMFSNGLLIKVYLCI